MSPLECAEAFESAMKEVGFYPSGGGDFTDQNGKHIWLVPIRVVPPPGATEVLWLKPYPPGMWVADNSYTTEELASGIAMAFDTPIAAAVYLRTFGN